MMRITVLILVFLSGPSIFSQTCCSGGVPLSNNLGLPNEGKGALLLGLNYDHNNLNTLNAGSDKLDDNSRKRITNSILLNLGYSFSDRFSVEGLLTWVNQTRTISQFGNENFTETNGIGDAVFLLKYAVPDILGSKALLNLGVGTKAPLGKSDLTTEEGFQLTADLQPGSGAWDAIGWLSVSKGLDFRPSATLSGNFTYRLTGKNSSYLNDTSVYEFGNVIQAQVGLTDEFLWFGTIFNPALILKYRQTSEDRIDASKLPNTGGRWVFVRPELQVQLTPKLSLVTRVELPMYSYVDGTQLTPTVRATAGISYIFRKNTVTIVN